MTALEIRIEAGADPGKVALCHVDGEVIDMEYCSEIVKRGAYLSFDSFNHEQCIPKMYQHLYGGNAGTDGQRIKAVKYILDKGYVKHVLLSQDTCHKTLLHKYGGYGYDHLITNITPLMLDEGVTREQIYEMFVANPARWLDTSV